MVKRFPRYSRSALTLFVIVGSIFLATQCINKEPNKNTVLQNADGQLFAGSAACANCHQNIAESHVKTAHYLTSRSTAEEYIKGNFEPGKNTFAFNRSVAVAIEKRTDGFYQAEYFRGIEKKARRMDVIIGSGTMGQSFLNWREQHLFQLPITYFAAADQWSNSPGFPDKVVFNRVITSRCLECHTTFVQTTSTPGKEPETFDHNKIIYGVDCEKCHGPAAQHVQFQKEHPEATTGKFIINPAKLSRQQNLDLCALCHGGRLQKTKPSFSFTAGNNLSDYFLVDTSAPNPDQIDVHGNQYGLLRASQCFQLSQMTCNTCHNTHQNEKGNTVLFSQRCINCHNPEHEKQCKLKPELGAAINNNCIDCHMPTKPSRAIAVFLPGSSTPTSALIRSHYISIYPEETKKLVPLIKAHIESRKQQ